MEKILVFSFIVIAVLYFIIDKSKLVINGDLDEWLKSVILVISHFMIYCLLKYCYDFVRWTIKWNGFYRYPYYNPFCILVMIYCIISFILLGTYYIKYQKNEYGTFRALFLFLTIHILAILLAKFFSPLIV